jgi:hypothetical protein
VLAAATPPFSSCRTLASSLSTSLDTDAEGRDLAAAVSAKSCLVLNLLRTVYAFLHRQLRSPGRLTVQHRPCGDNCGDNSGRHRAAPCGAQSGGWRHCRSEMAARCRRLGRYQDASSASLTASARRH